MGSIGFVRRRSIRFTLVSLVLSLLTSAGLRAQAPSPRPATIAVTVVDALGAPVPGASVELMVGAESKSRGTSDAKGQYRFSPVASGRYRLRVTAPGLTGKTIEPFFVGENGRVPVVVSLETGLQEHVVVTAAATEVPTSQVAASVSVVDHAQIAALQAPDVLDAVRLVPGVNAVQTGQRGGTTSLFIRGGNSNFTKLLVDGVPANDIGGGIDFATLANTGVESIEVLRDPNSAVYGSDAMAGVVNLTTERGTTRVPQTTLSFDGGNVSTSHQDATFGGAVRRVDYFSAVTHFDTDNQVPNDAYRNTSYAGRFGGVIGHVLLTGTLRTITARAGSPNAIDIYGLADDSTERNRYLFGSLAATFARGDRWQSTVRFGVMDRTQRFLNPTPTGDPFDPFGFGPNYLGNLVTIHGANGDSVTGRAILDFGGEYPSPFTSKAGRDSISGVTSYQFSSHLSISGGLRLDHERGADGVVDEPVVSTRNDAGGFGEARVTTGRLFATASLGVDHDRSFGTAATPRGSVAYYVRKPSDRRAVGSTKLTFNAGTGIKAPSVSQEESSLFAVASTVPSLANAAIAPIGPERTHGIDGGVEQGLWRERAHLRAIVFDNQFSDIIEFVSNTVLPELGISPTVASALPGGVYVNSSSFHARGLETSLDAQVSADLRVSASYTFLSAVITKSFTGGVLAPAVNPAFPGTPIGQFAPLVGAPPFRRPAHSGTIAAFYTAGPLSVAAVGQFAGKSDDSTFALDGFFGPSMLLPNHHLDAGYAKVDLSATAYLFPAIKVFLAFENLLDQHDEPAFGFPALGRTVRVGATVILGGHR